MRAITVSPSFLVMYGCLSDHLGSFHHVQERLFDRVQRHRFHAGSSDDDQIHVRRDDAFQSAYRLADQPLDPVPDHGVADFFADRNPGAKRGLSLLFGAIQDKLLVCRRAPLLKHCLEVLVFSEPMRTMQGKQPLTS